MVCPNLSLKRMITCREDNHNEIEVQNKCRYIPKISAFSDTPMQDPDVFSSDED